MIYLSFVLDSTAYVLIRLLQTAPPKTGKKNRTACLNLVVPLNIATSSIEQFDCFVDMRQSLLSLVLCIYLKDERAIAGQVWASTELPHAQIRTGDNNPRLEEQTWQARQIELGCGRDITLDWAELRRRVSMTDARLLLRTTALDLAIREKFVVFDLGVLRGYVDRDRCVLLLPTLADAQLSMTVPEGQKIPACRLFLSREHITRVEANIVEALSQPGGRRLSFTMVVVECILEEVGTPPPSPPYVAPYCCLFRRIGMLSKSSHDLSRLLALSLKHSVTLETRRRRGRARSVDFCHWRQSSRRKQCVGDVSTR